jgi:Holliday junction resolvase RusA-like endonuclease
MTALTIEWETVATFFVSGEPKAQPRVKARAIPTKKFNRGERVWIGSVYTPDTADGWKQAVRCYALQKRPAEPLTGPVRVDTVFYLPRPKKMMTAKYPDGPVLHVAKPDRDNCDKPILDALTKAGWWSDDCQVCAGEIVKVYASKRGTPGAQITVSVVANDGGLFGDLTAKGGA